MGGGVCCSFRKYQDKVFVFRTLGSLLLPSISTAVWSVNIPPPSSHKPLPSFGNIQIHLVSRYTTQPVSGLSLVCGRGHCGLMWGSPKTYWNSLYGEVTFRWLQPARAAHTLQQILSLQHGQRGLCAGISIALWGAAAGAGCFLQCLPCHYN